MKKFLNSKWASRKLWTLIGTVIFVILTEVLNVPISEEVYWGIIGVAITYIVGQSHIDAKEAQNKGKLQG